VKKVVWFHIILILLGLTFFVGWRFIEENPEPLQLQIFYWRLLPVSLGTLVLISLAIGFLVSFLIFMTWGASLLWETRRLRRETSSLQRMLDRHLASSNSRGQTSEKSL